MHRPTCKPRKFSFQSVQLIILLTTIVSSHASALRAKRGTNVGETPSAGTLPHATTTSSSKIVTESNFISMETTELEEFAGVGDSEIAMDVDTQSSLNFGESAGSRNAEATTMMSIAAQPQAPVNTNDSSTTTVKYADVTPLTTTSSTSRKVADITTAATTGSTPIMAALAPKPTTDDNLAEKLDAITTTTRAETFGMPTVAAVDESQVATVQSEDTEANITTEKSTELKTATMIFAETTQEALISMDKNRQNSNTIEETTPAEQLQETTVPFDVDTTMNNPDLTVNDLLTTTDAYVNSNMDTTTIDTQSFNGADAETTEMYIVTNQTTKDLKVDTNNYDVTINEIKKNATIEGPTAVDGKLDVQNKPVDDRRQFEQHITPATESPTGTTVEISSTSVKSKTTKSHKFIDGPDSIGTNDLDSVPVANHTFTSTGATANSIENTLEAGQIDDSVLNKIESRAAVLPKIPETKQAMTMLNSTPTVVDILLPSTPSLERNRVEEADDFAISTGHPGYDTNQPLTTTEKVQSSLPSSIMPFAAQGNKTTLVDFVDTTTKRIERSTSEPATMNSTTQKVMNSTTIGYYTPLSVMPIERELESTTETTRRSTEVAEGVPITTANQNIATNNDSNSKLTTEADIVASTTSNALVSESIPDMQNGESNTIQTSTAAFNTIRIATTLPSTTPMQSAKQPPTKASSKPAITKDPPTSTLNTTHVVSTEPIEEYSLQPRSNHSLESFDPQNIAATSSPITTTDLPGSESTEKVTTSEPNGGPDYNVIIATSVSVVGIVALILLVGFLYVMRKRQKSVSYGQRCRPVSLDAYSLDNVSIYNSVRRKGALRASKRSYGNAAFDDPSLKHNPMGIHELTKFVERRIAIHEEFREVPQINSRPDEVPPGCEDRNRYANVIPLPETRVILNRIGDDDKSEYINANYVRGPKDPANYYIASQAPLDSTISDFWRMIWEQNSRVIIMATGLIENGVEKCAEYVPASMTLDNYVVYGDYQIVLKSREVKDKYAVSTIHVKNIVLNRWREIIHFWYQWPETGVPTDEASVIAMLLEARSYLKMGTPERSEEEMDKAELGANGSTGSLDKTKSLSKTQGPLTVHCSSGTGRTGTIVACDIALRSLEMPKRIIDIPQFVYYVRRGRASAVQTKEQYEFIYKVAHMYATKISGPINDN